MLRMAESLGTRIENENSDDIDEQITRAWNLVLGREPDEQERASAHALLKEYDLALVARVLFNSNELIWID